MIILVSMKSCQSFDPVSFQSKFHVYLFGVCVCDKANVLMRYALLACEATRG